MLKYIPKILLVSAFFGFLFSLLFHLLVIPNFEEFDVVRNLQQGKGAVSFNMPEKVDQYYLKFSTTDAFKPEEVQIYINDVLVPGLEYDTDPGVLNFKGLVPVEMVRPGTNWVKVLKKGTEEHSLSVDRVTLKNSRKKGVQDNLFIMFKASPRIVKDIRLLLGMSLYGWLFATVLLSLTMLLCVKLISFGRSADPSRLVRIDATTYIAPLAVLAGLFISSLFSKYYLIINSEFFWFSAVFFALLSKIVIYLSTAFRREFAQGFVLTMKKAIKNPVNTIIVIGLILIMLIPLPGLIYPYFPIRDVALVAEHDAEIFANIAYVLLLVGAVCKFIQDYRRMRKEQKQGAAQGAK